MPAGKVSPLGRRCQDRRDPLACLHFPERRKQWSGRRGRSLDDAVESGDPRVTEPPMETRRNATMAGRSRPRPRSLTFRLMPTLNELLHAASRTFAIGIDLLPEPLRSEIEVAYLLLRVSDYLEDNEEMPAERKAALLDRWAAVLEGDEAVEELATVLENTRSDTPDALVARNATRVYEGFLALRPDARDVVGRHVRDSTRGMARWALRGPDIADESELDDYMHEVAGRVGWLLTELFALDIPEVARERDAMMRLGREFGLALQTVNVVRGLHSDWERGWIYIPRSFLPGDASTPTELFEARDDEGRRRREVEVAVLNRLVEKSDRHLAAARSYIARIPRRHHGIRQFCLLPLLFAVRTLALSRDNPRVFDEEVKMGRDEVRGIVRAARIMGFSNRWVGWYCRRLEKVGETDAEASAGSY